jgi:hypothetical protein
MKDDGEKRFSLLAIVFTKASNDMGAACTAFSH